MCLSPAVSYCISIVECRLYILSFTYMYAIQYLLFIQYKKCVVCHVLGVGFWGTTHVHVHAKLEWESRWAQEKSTGIHVHVLNHICVIRFKKVKGSTLKWLLRLTMSYVNKPKFRCCSVQNTCTWTCNCRTYCTKKHCMQITFWLLKFYSL